MVPFFLLQYSFSVEELSSDAKKFFELMSIEKKEAAEGRREESFTTWLHKKCFMKYFLILIHFVVIWHPAPFFNQEERRRLIGNDSATLFFKDRGDPFDPTETEKLGAMPQFYVVVQPHNNERYRCLFFPCLISFFR